MDGFEEKIKVAAEWLGEAQKVCVLTGAGVSAESGVPTFRGADGLWKKYRVTELATPQAFSNNPELVWEFYNWRRELIARVKPNPAHYALAELERKKQGFVLVTQNVDGLHHRAGSKTVLQIHGSIWRVKCSSCSFDAEDKRVPLPDLPKCPECGALLRPGVVWFGEALDSKILERAFRASRDCDLMLMIGTSAMVQPAASLPLEAKASGSKVIEINLEKTPHTGVLDMSIFGKAGRILPQLVKLV